MKFIHNPEFNNLYPAKEDWKYRILQQYTCQIKLLTFIDKKRRITPF